MNMIYGVAWFGGSALLGVLYDQTSALWLRLPPRPCNWLPFLFSYC